jgi:Fe-S cluster biosynthesis and repair protein YggX
MADVSKIFEDLFKMKPSRIGWKIFNHQHNRVVESKKTILINGSKSEPQVKQNLSDMLTFKNSLCFQNYFEYINGKFALKMDMEEIFAEIGNGKDYYTHGNIIFVVLKSGRVAQAAYHDNKFMPQLDYDDARRNLMGSGCLSYSDIKLAVFPSGWKPSVDLFGIVTLPRDHNNEGSILLTEIMMINDQEITILLNELNLADDEDREIIEKEATVYSYRVREGAISVQVYDIDQPSWFSYIKSKGDFIKNPLNKSVWKIFDELENKSEPKYDSNRIFVDYNEDIYVNSSQGWERTVKKDIQNLGKEIYNEYLMYTNVASIGNY